MYCIGPGRLICFVSRGQSIKKKELTYYYGSAIKEFKVAVQSSVCLPASKLPLTLLPVGSTE